MSEKYGKPVDGFIGAVDAVIDSSGDFTAGNLSFGQPLHPLNVRGVKCYATVPELRGVLAGVLPYGVDMAVDAQYQYGASGYRLLTRAYRQFGARDKVALSYWQNRDEVKAAASYKGKEIRVPSNEIEIAMLGLVASRAPIVQEVHDLSGSADAFLMGVVQIGRRLDPVYSFSRDVRTWSAGIANSTPLRQVLVSRESNIMGNSHSVATSSLVTAERLKDDPDVIDCALVKRTLKAVVKRLSQVVVVSTEQQIFTMQPTVIQWPDGERQSDVAWRRTPYERLPNSLQEQIVPQTVATAATPKELHDAIMLLGGSSMQVFGLPSMRRPDKDK